MQLLEDLANESSKVLAQDFVEGMPLKMGGKILNREGRNLLRVALGRCHS
jgi:hypothetical protein